LIAGSLLRIEIPDPGLPPHESKSFCVYLPATCCLSACCFRGGAAAEENFSDRVSSFDPATESTHAEGIRLALRDLGYIEGQNIAIEYRYARNEWGQDS
jgi:hypothetical protein